MQFVKVDVPIEKSSTYIGYHNEKADWQVGT